MKQKMVIKFSMNVKNSRPKALTIAAGQPGVESVAWQGEDKDQLVVIGEGTDSVVLTTLLRKSMGYADILSVGPPEDPKKEEEEKEKKKKEEEEKAKKKKEEEEKAKKKKEEEENEKKKKEEEENEKKKKEPVIQPITWPTIHQGVPPYSAYEVRSYDQEACCTIM